jgi:SAM-dependent methyltransferase
MVFREKYVALCDLLRESGLSPLDEKTIFEIGCGSGKNLLLFILLGFQPKNILANDLLAERATQAGRNLPCLVRVIQGDASKLDLPPESFDVVFQSTVFTSILDDAFQEKLANRMWSWVKPGGGVLWYDFIYNPTT